MKNIKIAIQDGLPEVKEALTTEGYEVYRYGEAGLDADITIITGVDDVYEEIQPSEYHQNGKKEMLIIDGTNKSTATILENVHSFIKR